MMNFSSKWKILSISLMVILASGLAAPQAYAIINQDILSVVLNIQSKLNSATNGLQAILNAVNTKASQTSVNNLQTTADAIKAKTDNLPSDPASNSAITSATSQIKGASYVLKDLGISQKQFNATHNSVLFTSIKCDSNYIVNSIRVQTSFDSLNDNFKINFVRDQEAAPSLPSPSHIYLSDTSEVGGALETEIVKQVGLPISMPANVALEVQIQQTNTDGSQNTLYVRPMIFAAQDAICSTVITGPIST